MIILGVNEYEPGPGHFIVKQRYDHEHIGHNTGKNQGKDLSGEDFNRVYEYENAKGLYSSIFAMIALTIYNL